MTPDERLARLAAGQEPKLIARMESGFAVMGDSQYLPGYALLLAHPKAGQLNELEREARAQFLADMARLGDAVKAATGCVRVNYSIYGNLDPFLHAHVWPRYADEEEAHRTSPPFSIPAEMRASVPYDAARHGELQRAIAQALAG
jgi:diadenosine tetraphosphate (Ap4A) HIT family hydrolase